MTFILLNADGAHSSDQDSTLESGIQALILAYFVALAKLFTEAQLHGCYPTPTLTNRGTYNTTSNAACKYNLSFHPYLTYCDTIFHHTHVSLAE